MENKLRKRKRPPHFPGIDRHNRAIIHFVTVCTKNRRPLLATDQMQRILLEAWAAADTFMVGRYVIMPDHIHLFCAPMETGPGYMEPWIRYWNSLSTRLRPEIGQGNLWQRDFWDTQMRSGENYSSQWDYVRFNPVRHGLVMAADEWPYQGEVNLFDWHD